MTQGPNKFIWYELMTTDQDAAEAFYRAVVG
ncbi:MAG: VOC family protein [Gammaproteobacteria bacterium]